MKFIEFICLILFCVGLTRQSPLPQPGVLLDILADVLDPGHHHHHHHHYYNQPSGFGESHEGVHYHQQSQNGGQYNLQPGGYPHYQGQPDNTGNSNQGYPFGSLFEGNANAEGVGNGAIQNGAAIGQGTGIAQAGPDGFGIGLGIGAAVQSPLGSFVIGQGNSAASGK